VTRFIDLPAPSRRSISKELSLLQAAAPSSEKTLLRNQATFVVLVSPNPQSIFFPVAKKQNRSSTN